jgi:F420H(2)-dependent quinone reductase
MLTRIQNWLITHVHRAIYVLSRGRLGGGTLVGLQIVMLTTTGRKSGKHRTIPLNALADGEHWVIVASNGGLSTHPQWYFNLLANPTVGLEVRHEKFTATARTATPDEKAAFWPRITTTAKNYDGYQSKTSRDIPLVVLTRT